MPTVNGGPTAPFPLTTRMDYENTTPDTNMDGIVQVPTNLSSLGNDTGVMAFQADRNAAQVYLPIFTDTTGALPIHGYIQEGAFSLTGVDGDALTSDELSNLYSNPSGAFTNPVTGGADGYNQYLNPNGLPYAYSLDTYTRINEILNDAVNHVKRIEVIRPGGNAVVFDFPWNPQTNSFNPIGTPVGYLVNGVAREADRTYVLRDLTTNDASETSESGGNLHKYALGFASGIAQTFSAGTNDKGTISSVSNAQGLSQDVTSYLSSSTTTSYHFNQALANNTTDTLDSSRYKITFNLSNNDNQTAYQGRIESIDYQTITPSSVSPQTVHTAITYNSSNHITALTKTDTTTSSSMGAFSYTLSTDGTMITRDGVQVTRTGTFTDGAASTVTLTTAGGSSDNTLVGSLAEAITFNSDGLVSIDSVTLDEGYSGTGIPTPTQLSAATTYAYEPRIANDPNSPYQFATPGHYYANGGASWGEVTLVTNPDRSWVAYKYDDGTHTPLGGSAGAQPTGWLIEQMTPFQSASPFWGESSNVVQYYDYTASGYDGNLAPNVPVIAFGGQAADPMNLVESPRHARTEVGGIITSDVFNRYGATGTSAETTVVTRRALDSGSDDNWNTAVFQTQNTINYKPGTGPNTGLTATSSGFTGNTTSTSSVDSNNNINSSVSSSWGNDTLSSQSETINPFDNALSATDGTIDQPYNADAETLPDAFGNYGSDSETGGVTTTATFPNTGNFWFGPQTVTEKDGSTTNYNYNNMGEVATKTIYAGTSHSISYSYKYDFAGHVISMTAQAVSDSSLTFKNTYQYDAQGRLYQEIDNTTGNDVTANRKTTYAWTKGGDFLSPTNILTITHPDGGTEIDTFYLDGSRVSTGGTAVTPATYNEGVIVTPGYDVNFHRDANVEVGSTWTSVTAGGSQNTTTTYTNMLGEQYLSQENTPSTNHQSSTTIDATAGLDASGHPRGFDNNGRPIKTVGYDGTNTLTVYDPVNGQAAASIVDMNRNGVYDPGVDRKSVQSLAAAPTGPGQPVTNNSETLSSTGVQNSSQTTTLNGSGSDVSENDNNAITDTKTAPPANGGWVTTTKNPDLTESVDTYADGLLIEEQHLGTDDRTDIVGPTLYFYNGLRELTKKIDYTGTTTYTYFQDGTQASVQTPGHAAQTTNAIDPATNTATTTTRPDNGIDNTPQNLFGQTTYQTGPGLLSASFSYDDTTGSQTGQLSSLTTFQGTASLNGNGALTGTGAATTSWAYDPNTGLLASKTYADGTQDKYQYNAAGQLINAIEPGITSSSFGYDNAGEQTFSSYTDALTGTVSSSITPDDLGRPGVVSSTDNGVSTTEVNLFNVNNQPSQTIFGSSLAQVQYDYYPASANTGNASPLALSTLSIQSLSGSTLASNTYAYASPSDTVSRRLGVITLPGASPVTITYFYFGDTGGGKADASNQVQEVQVLPSNGSSGVTITYLRDTVPGGSEGRITDVGASANGGPFDDAATGSPIFNQQDQIAGQRIEQPAIGSQVEQYDTWSYSYSSSEADALTTATDFNTHSAATTTYAYNYDSVGNRTGTSLGTPNLVNEYSNLTYNSRGDLTSDGTYKYGYDALDRLISVTPISPSAASKQEQYGYDSQGRRLWKEVYTWNATTGSWAYSYARDYVWDGNNLTAELDGNGNLVIRYIYGPTGLIAEQDYPADSNYSALLTVAGDPSGQPVTIVAVADLSGNVDELVDARNGTIVGEFRYDPWGNVLSAVGAATNLDGFRAKGYWVDAEAPWLGESPQPGDGMPHAFNFALEIWMQRDRADQSQVISVTGVPFNNDPINNIDPNGLAAVPANSAWHHLLSKVVFDAANRASYLNQLGMTLADGIDIHSAEWGWMVPSDYHNPVLHSNANELEATWQVSDRAWLRALHERGVTTITRQMLARHVADMKKAYGLIDEAGAALQGEPAKAAWRGAADYFAGLKGNLIIRNVRSPAIRAWLRGRIGGARGGFAVPELIPYLITAVALAIDAVQVGRSDLPAQTAAEKIGGWGGMLGGAEFFGALGEGIAGPIGGVAGLLIGSVVGYNVGQETMRRAVPFRSMSEARKQLEDYMDRNSIPKADEGEYGPMAWVIDAARMVSDAAKADGYAAPGDPENEE